MTFTGGSYMNISSQELEFISLREIWNLDLFFKISFFVILF